MGSDDMTKALGRRRKIPPGRLEAGVAEQLLELDDIGAGLERGRGEGMP
jgi:hypothetical protein